ncbi:MAG: sigma-70 family RNA polymerase sigma factor [Sphingomonadaceae bacterium]|nr:sigma-70 family RNA polymerase sigma factor [Sphingomonadaceae bacterium]
MKHDHSAFGASASTSASVANAYTGDTADRIRRFLPMVKRLAWHVYGSGRQGIELEDLMQSGLVALTECAQRHEGPGEDGFAAYAKMRVRGAMVDLIRRTIPLTRGGTQRRRMLREATEKLRQELGRDPTTPELAKALEVNEAELAALRSSSEPMRFEPIDEVYSDSDTAFADDLPDSLELLENEEMREQVGAAILALPQRLQLVIQLYFVEELNLSEIAEVLCVSVPRIHQLKAGALQKMRESLEGTIEMI